TAATPTTEPTANAQRAVRLLGFVVGASPSGAVRSSMNRRYETEKAAPSPGAAILLVRNALGRIGRESSVRLQSLQEVECVFDLLVVLCLRRDIGRRAGLLAAGAFAIEVALEACLATRLV